MTNYNLSNLPSVFQSGDTVTVDYTRNVQTFDIPAGDWQIECWGARGGGLQDVASVLSSKGEGGKGGYIKGQINIETITRLLLYVGGKGSLAATVTSGELWTEGGWNGGGAATYDAGTGGGATDIRTTANLGDRIIVAAGGGGAGGREGTSYKADGGAGGGENGTNGGYRGTSPSTNVYAGKGASRTAGGAAGSYANFPAEAGAFGVGGKAGRYSNTTNRGSGGGGAGWYGGGGGAFYYAGGGGGSSYADDSLFLQIETETGVNDDDGKIVFTYLTSVEPPTNLQQNGTSKTEVNLSWQGGGNSFNIYLDNKLYGTTSNNSFVIPTFPSQSYTAYVTAITGGIESEPSNIITVTTETGTYEDWMNLLITDRTLADVQAVKAAAEKIKNGLAAAEWFSNMKGAYNAYDVNRVSAFIDWIAAELKAEGYNCQPYLHTLWTETETFFKTDLINYLSAVAEVKNALGVLLPLPTVITTYTEANQIEQILETVSFYLKNIILSYIYMNDLTAGDDNNR